MALRIQTQAGSHYIHSTDARGLVFDAPYIELQQTLTNLLNQVNNCDSNEKLRVGLFNLASDTM